MPRKGIPTNWRAAEYSTILAGTVKTLQSNLLNGAGVEQFKDDFISEVVELVAALRWQHDLAKDLDLLLGIQAAPTIKATIVEQPKPDWTLNRLEAKEL